jgi:spore maturation protein SpmA
MAWIAPLFNCFAVDVPFGGVTPAFFKEIIMSLTTRAGLGNTATPTGMKAAARVKATNKFHALSMDEAMKLVMQKFPMLHERRAMMREAKKLIEQHEKDAQGGKPA